MPPRSVRCPPDNANVMLPDLTPLLPNHKSDLERARAVVALGYPAIAQIVPGVLEWLQDINWPVAHIFAPFLASIGPELAPYVRTVLETDDDVWKYYLIQAVVAASPELAKALKPELERIVQNPTPSERHEEVNAVALEALEQLG